jgi:uncharacterized protein
MMSRGRLFLLAGLIALPILFLLGSGAYFLWEKGWSFYAWWPMGLCLATAYILAWRWQKKIRAKQAQTQPSLHWTDRDREAWKVVEARVKAADTVPSTKFEEPRFYFDTAQEMAQELSRAYRPDSTDPIGIVTVPEILTVIELAAQDLNEMVKSYVPGSHLMTVDHWKKARRAIDWYRNASNAYWLASAVLDPIRTATRYVAAKYGMGKPLEAFQQNVILWFYAAYVRELGFYLVELYSGRLKVGTVRYRELMAAHKHDPGVVVTPEDADASVPVEEPPKQSAAGVGIIVIGQVKAGKSSLINALLGEQRAATDILPLTDEVTKYDLKSPGVPKHLVLLDTTGYGRAGAEKDNLEETAQAVQGSDLVMIATHARSPGRKADVDFYARLREWVKARPQLRFPPVLAVVTHVDLLTPAMEWAPPYDWATGTRPKEKSIRDAVEAVREAFPGVQGVIPVCAAEGRVWNVQEQLLPAIVELLGEAKAVALLRCLHAEADDGKVRKVFTQMWEAGKKIAGLLRGGLSS